MNLPTALFESPVTSACAEAACRHLHAAREICRAGAEWPRIDALPPDGTLAVVGAGTMGSGIAQAATAAGLRTVLIDERPEGLARGAQRIRDSLDGQVASGRLDAAERAARLARLHATTDWAELRSANIVIEAVFESLPVKQALMAHLHRLCPARTLLVSNTSTLDLDHIAACSGRPGQLVGMHFLTPAHVTPLLEVVRTRTADASSLARARRLAERLGKLAVMSGNAWGFIGNRLFEPYLREVDALQLEGVGAARIDQALEAWGMAIGPCRSLDMAGTDLVSQVVAERGRLFAQGPSYRRITRRLAELGRFGHKSGRGHYLYEGRRAVPDPELARVCAEAAAELGIAQRPDVTDADIVARCVGPLVEEGRQVLAEGVACRASDIDLVWVLGYGFPADRGGPMFFAGLA